MSLIDNINAKKPIVVLGPMDSESAYLAGLLQNAETEYISGFRFTKGTISGYPVIVVRSLIGMVNNTMAAMISVFRYNPACIIIEGTSGGHNEELHQGDIVLGESFRELGSFYTEHRDEGAGVAHEEWTFPGEEMPVDREIKRVKVLHSDKELLNIASEITNEYGRVVNGTIGSADIWDKEIDRIRFLNRTLGTDCEEMEGFAVAQVCHTFDMPCLGVRVISNSELHPEEIFNEIYGTYSQKFVEKLIQRIAEGNI